MLDHLGEGRLRKRVRQGNGVASWGALAVIRSVIRSVGPGQRGGVEEAAHGVEIHVGNAGPGRVPARDGGGRGHTVASALGSKRLRTPRCVCAVPFAHVIRSWIYTDKWEIPVRSMMCMYVLDRGDAYLD